MKKLIVWSILGISCWILLNGCAQKQIYYFGNYSKTLYSYEKNKDEASFLKHKQELERIISESETRTMIVPPGIYAELGFINLKINKSKQAVHYFQAEKNIYPESQFLMDRLITKAEKKKTIIENSN